MTVLKRNYVLFSHLFGELQQSCICLIMAMEGVLHTQELSGKCKEFHSVWRVVTLQIFYFAAIFS